MILFRFCFTSGSRSGYNLVVSQSPVEDVRMPTLEFLEWTGKILAVVGPLLTFMWWGFRTYNRYVRLQAEHADLKKMVEIERADSAKEIESIRRERDTIRDDLKRTDVEKDRLSHDLAELRARVGSSSGMSPKIMERMIRDYRHDLERLTSDRHSAQAQAIQLGERLQAADEERVGLRGQLGEEREKTAQLSQEMERRVEQLLRVGDDLQDRLKKADELRQVESDRVAQLATELSEARHHLDESEERFAELMTRLDGRLWLRPATDPPRFRSLPDRRTVIISILNLKGGVGKTTITANLGATLGEQGNRVLMIDLDYQRSLSMLLLGEPARQLLHYRRKCLQHVLGGSDRTLQQLLDCGELVGKEAPGCTVVTNSDVREGELVDSLEETENRLMLEWLAKPTGPDVRFLLREALHAPGLAHQFDIVLLDCPPRLTTACVNALAASDFVLIPVVPDAVSTRAVENLLRSLARLRSTVCPDVGLLGIVPNMVRIISGTLIQPHDAALVSVKELAAAGRLWPEPVPVFEAMVPDNTAFVKTAAMLDSSGTLRLAFRDSKVEAAFRALAKELQEEVKHHASRHSSTVPAKPGARVEGRRRSGTIGS
jgi:cellulose biosynthesis protein BcsQ